MGPRLKVSSDSVREKVPSQDQSQLRQPGLQVVLGKDSRGKSPARTLPREQGGSLATANLQDSGRGGGSGVGFGPCLATPPTSPHTATRVDRTAQGGLPTSAHTLSHSYPDSPARGLPEPRPNDCPLRPHTLSHRPWPRRDLSISSQLWDQSRNLPRSTIFRGSRSLLSSAGPGVQATPFAPRLEARRPEGLSPSPSGRTDGRDDDSPKGRLAARGLSITSSVRAHRPWRVLALQVHSRGVSPFYRQRP